MFRDHHLDCREPPFGSLRSFRSSVARVALELGLELMDAFLRCDEVGAFPGAEPRLETSVNTILSPPDIDRLIADPEIA